MVTESRSAKEGSKQKKTCWDQVDGSSGGTLGTREAGAREGGGGEWPGIRDLCSEHHSGISK